MRRQFRLPEADEVFLDSLGQPWETIIEGGVRWVLIHERPLPSGYNIDRVSEAHRIDAGYPDSQLDMVYFFPALSRSDGKPIGALSAQPLDGNTWQRWSRHRDGQHPWRPGQDDISTHLFLVDHWLEREFAK